MNDDKALQEQHEEILKLKQRVTEQQQIMKAKNIDTTTIGKQVKRAVQEKEKKISELEHKTFLLNKVKEQDLKKHQNQMKDMQSELDRVIYELDRVKAIVKQHNLGHLLKEINNTTSPLKKENANHKDTKENTLKETTTVTVTPTKDKNGKELKPSKIPKPNAKSSPTTNATTTKVNRSKKTTTTTTKTTSPSQIKPRKIISTKETNDSPKKDQESEEEEVHSEPEDSEEEEEEEEHKSDSESEDETNEEQPEIKAPLPRRPDSKPIIKREAPALVPVNENLHAPVEARSSSAPDLALNLPDDTNKPKKDLSNPFSKLQNSPVVPSTTTSALVSPRLLSSRGHDKPVAAQEPSPVPPVTQPTIVQPPKPMFLGASNAAPADATANSKPSWYAAPAAAPVQHDIFKPNFGITVRKDKDKWKSKPF